MMSQLPTGMATFLFTDIECSAKLEQDSHSQFGENGVKPG
jgi:hypothetical protein